MSDARNSDKAKQRLYQAARRILQHTPEQLSQFENVWKHRYERDVFNFLEELTRTMPYQVDEDFNKAMDDYFWLYCH